MREKRHFGVAGFLFGLVLAGYFGAYFLAADYIDVGSNTPLYLVRYRVGSVSGHRLASFFEPARRVDELCFRRKRAVVLE